MREERKLPGIMALKDLLMLGVRRMSGGLVAILLFKLVLPGNTTFWAASKVYNSHEALK